MAGKDKVFLDDDDADDERGGAGRRETPGVDPFADMKVDIGDHALAEAPGQQPAAPTGRPGFDPFADMQVQNPPATAPEGMLPDAPGSAASGAALDEQVDPNLKPGSRKDLWACPHCGAKNKPGRESCRTCGKSPDEAVEVALWKRPPVLVGGIVAVLALLGLLTLCGTSYERLPAGAAHVERRLRLGGAAGGSVELASGQLFQPERRLAISGRIVQADLSQYADHRTRSVVIAFGDRAKIADDEVFGRIGARIDEDRFEVQLAGEPLPAGIAYAYLHLLDPQGELPELRSGQYLSLSGRAGRVADLNWTVGLRRHEYVVLPEGGVLVAE